MKEIEYEVKTNFCKVSDELQKMITIWQNFLKAHFDNIKKFVVFSYTDNIVFADVLLENKSYGQYTISSNAVHFGGHTCTFAECDILEKATYNDPCYKGELRK